MADDASASRSPGARRSSTCTRTSIIPPRGAGTGSASTRRGSAPASGSASARTSPRSSAAGATSRPRIFRRHPNVTSGNDAMLALQDAHPDRIRCYVIVNPNDTAHAREEIERCVGRGAVGIKLAASRRADDALLDPIAEEASKRGLPVLHHIWQHRTREWPGQEISDGADLGRLARAPSARVVHPRAHRRRRRLGAQLRGGAPTSRTSSSISPGAASIAGCSISRTPRWARRACSGGATSRWRRDSRSCARSRRSGLNDDELEEVRWRNAARIFPHNALPGIPTSGVAARRTDAQPRVPQ